MRLPGNCPPVSGVFCRKFPEMRPRPVSGPSGEHNAQPHKLTAAAKWSVYGEKPAGSVLYSDAGGRRPLRNAKQQRPLAMRSLYIALGLLAFAPVGVVAALVASGTVDANSLSMMLNLMTGADGPTADESTLARRYEVPDGFQLSLYTADLPRARFLRFTPGGDLLVSRPHEGDIVLLEKDLDGDGRPDGTRTLLANLQRPLGIDIHDNWLYIAESGRVSKIRFDSASGQTSGELQTVVPNLTDDGNHWSKTLRIGPDEQLYLSQGSTCNICEEEDQRRATMMRFELDGSDGEIIATGLRNSVGFDWAPWDQALYATDNGRDLLGDDTPPCELNHIQPGKFYGWPYFYGNNIADPDMNADPQAAERSPTQPVHPFRAHNAPLGITFLEASELPDTYTKSALVALHGSWNRSSLDGYKVVSLHWTPAGIEERDFLTGFLRDGEISGRPVDVAQAPDGSIYISDDYAGAIYRVTYEPDREGSALPMPQPISRLDETPPQWLANADLPAMASSGEMLYQKLGCRSCHDEGENPSRLDALSTRLGYSATINALAYPQAPMPVFPLSDTERRELAVYLLWNPESAD